MRALALLALLAAAAAAGETRTVRDAAGRIQIDLPPTWEDQPLAEGQVLHAYAKHGGGHVLIVVREAGQAEIDKQRDRYMAHDAANYPGSEFSKIADPFFGYRMNDKAKNRVLLRAFLRDGEDGIVATVSSRLQAYDKAYAEHTTGTLGTLRVVAADAPKAEEAAPATAARRIFDASGIFSFVAPADWKPITAGEGERMALGLRGSSTTAAIRIVDEGDGDNPTLVLIAIQGRMKRDYASCTAERLATEPPAVLVKNRKEGWVDYVLAFAAGGRCYSLRLESREGAFEGIQVVADGMARSIVAMGDPYKEPASVPGDVVRDTKKGFVVHAATADAAAAERTAADTAPFDKDWAKVAPVYDRKATPLHIRIVRPEAFADATDGFGEIPVAYDRRSCVVVALPKPSDGDEEARWRGRLFAALAEAALHRDLRFAPPPWLLAGLAACLESAGRTGDGPDAKHAAFVPLLEPEKTVALDQALAYSYTDVLRGETPMPAAISWGYVHLMLFGKGPARSAYAKWVREVAKATRAAPPFDASKVDAQAELKRYIERELRK